MKKKVLLSALLSSTLLGSAMVGTADAAAMSVSIDGTPLKFNTSPIVRESTTMVQIAPIFRSLGISFDWDQKNKQITATKNGTKIVMTLGSKNVYVNGNRTVIQQPPISVNGNIFVPLRFISEVTGATVNVKGNKIDVYSYKGSVPYTYIPTVPAPSTNSSSSTVSRIESYLNQNYGTVYSAKHAFDVWYTVRKAGAGYSITMSLGNLTDMHTLLQDAQSDMEIMEKLTRDFTEELHVRFGIDTFLEYIYLTTELSFYPETDLSNAEITPLDNGNYLLIVPELAGYYDFKGGKAQFFYFSEDGELSLMSQTYL